MLNAFKVCNLKAQVQPMLCMIFTGSIAVRRRAIAMKVWSSYCKSIVLKALAELSTINLTVTDARKFALGITCIFFLEKVALFLPNMFLGLPKRAHF